MNTLTPSAGHQFGVSPGLQRLCSEPFPLAIIESFTQLETDIDLGAAANFCYSKDISDLPDSYRPIRWYDRSYFPNPPVPPDYTKAVQTGPFSSGYGSVGDFLLFNQFKMTVGPSNFPADDLWGTPNRYAGQLAWIGDFSAGLSGYRVCRSKVRIRPVEASEAAGLGVRAWLIPRIFWMCEFLFTYDSGLFKMVLSPTAEFKGNVTMALNVWFDPLFGSFSPFLTINRLRLLIIGESPAAWQIRTGIALTYPP